MPLAHGWNVEQVATFLDWAPQTVRITIHRWEQHGLSGLWDAPGRGRKPCWQEDDFTYLEQTLQQEPRTYNAHQLAQKLAQERHVVLSADRIRRVLKKGLPLETHTRP